MLASGDARRVQEAIAAAPSVRAARRAHAELQRTMAAMITPEALQRIRAALAEVAAGLRARDVQAALRVSSTCAPTAPSQPAPEPPAAETAPVLDIAPGDDYLVALSDVINVVQEADIKNPRTLKAYSAAAIYKGVQHELRRREAGERPDRTNLYGVVADARDPRTGKYRLAAFGEGLNALAAGRAKAQGVLEEALALASVESGWSAEQTRLARRRR